MARAQKTVMEVTADRKSRKKMRNHQIYLERLAGADLISLSIKYGLSQPRITQIVQREMLDYCESVKKQTLSTVQIENLITAIDQLKQGDRKELLSSNKSSELMIAVSCMCEYTKQLSIANRIPIYEDYTEKEKEDIILKLRKTLKFQKAIFDVAA